MVNARYKKYFSKDKFLRLIRKVTKIVPFGREALAMFYCWDDPYTPQWVKAMIVAALAYFIFPLDAIPDAAPIIGWLDDAGVIIAAYNIINNYIKDKHWKRADRFLEDT